MQDHKSKPIMTRVDYSKTFSYSTLEKCDINIIGGNFLIKHGSENEISLRVQWQENAAAYFITCEVKNDILVVRSKSWKPYLSQKEIYIIELTIPTHIPINIKMFGGVIFFDDIHAHTNVFLKGGEIVGTLEGKQTTLKLWAGNIDVVFSHVDASSEIDLTCYLGSIKATFPTECKIHHNVRLLTEKYRIQNSLGADIRAYVLLGDVVLK